METSCNWFIQSSENRMKNFRFLEESSKSIGKKDYDTSRKYKATASGTGPRSPKDQTMLYASSLRLRYVHYVQVNLYCNLFHQVLCY